LKLSMAAARKMGIDVGADLRNRKVKRGKPAVPFETLCKAHGLPVPIPEYLFNTDRRWRLDFFWPVIGLEPLRGLALEIQGGIFSGGRHVRGAAMLGEFEKIAASVSSGIPVVFCTPQQVQDGSAFAMVRGILTAWGYLP
jgi:hypothetical protein